MEINKTNIGRKSEQLVLTALQGRGLEILGVNVKGKNYEIDLIGRNGCKIFIIEVKYRSIFPETPRMWRDVLPKSKKAALRRGALAYLKKNAISTSSVILRLDLAFVYPDKGELKLKYIDNVPWG